MTMATEATDGRVDKLYTDMYLGEGKDNPPMTVRVDRLEKCVSDIVQNTKDTRSMMLVTLLSVLSAIVVAFICFKAGWAHV